MSTGARIQFAPPASQTRSGATYGTNGLNNYGTTYNSVDYDRTPNFTRNNDPNEPDYSMRGLQTYVNTNINKYKGRINRGGKSRRNKSRRNKSIRNKSRRNKSRRNNRK